MSSDLRVGWGCGPTGYTFYKDALAQAEPSISFLSWSLHPSPAPNTDTTSKRHHCQQPWGDHAPITTATT